MSDNNSPFIISVIGAHSNLGKTTLCSILLGDLKGFGAVKFTKTEMYTSIIDDLEILNQKGKDTAVMLEAGAEKVVWIKSPREGLKGALDIAFSKLYGLKGVVVEGNSPVDFLNPSLVIFIVNPDGEIKPSAVEVCKKADIVIINTDKEIKEPGFSTAIFPEKAVFFRINLKNEEGEIDKFLSHVKRKIIREKD
jgi:molybdopterin-guanine dinucleotide biosynthesis protein